MQSFTPANLKAEITADPAGLGYASHVTTGDDAGVAAILNDATRQNTATPPGPLFTVTRPSVPANAALSYLAVGDIASLTQNQMLFLVAIASAGDLVLVDPLSGAQSQEDAGLLGLFPSTTTSGANLRNLSNRPCSRAEFLFGPDSLISNTDIAKALRG